MSPSRLRSLLYVALLALFVVRNDFWLWNDGRLLLGLPIGLTYHVLFCGVTAAVMALLVRHAWPSNLGLETDEADLDA